MASRKARRTGGRASSHRLMARNGIDAIRLDFETGNISQFSGVEAANPARQLQVVTSPVRQGRYSGRFEIAPGDVWANGSIRSLATHYWTNEAEGDDKYFAFSMYFPAQLYNACILWELHPRADFAINPNLTVVPHAIHNSGPDLYYGLLTGPGFWNGSAWTGWSHYEPSILLLSSYPTNQWIDFVVHINLTRTDTGTLEAWYRVGTDAWPTTPQVSRTAVSTLQWIPGYNNQVFGHTNDPAIPDDVYITSLYAEMGLYPGLSSISQTDVIYIDGYRRGVSKAAVMAEFPT